MANPQVNGLGGWLILVGIGVVTGPFSLLKDAYPAFMSFFQDGVWEKLTTAGTELYSPALAVIVLLEMFVNAAMFIAGLWLIYLFFSRHYRFPRVYIGLYVASLIIAVADAVLIAAVAPGQAPIYSDLSLIIFTGLIGAAIWIPYMIYSERVRATFVKARPTGSQQADVFA